MKRNYAVVCQRCGSKASDESKPRCGACGSLLEVRIQVRRTNRASLDGRARMWQFKQFLPVAGGEEPVTLGEGLTPICDYTAEDFPKTFFKMEYVNPTCSFKDRTASLLITKAVSMGFKSVVIDSSGNAAASTSAYAARANLKCEAFVPAKTSPNKVEQISAYGASVTKVQGTRQDVLNRAIAFADKSGAYYCGFQLNPFASEANKTVAYEVALQRADAPPDTVVLPMGTGGLLIGCSKGFEELKAMGWLDKSPRMIGVQAEGCSPIVKAFEEGREVVPVDHPETVAEGLKIGNPYKGSVAVKKIADSGGMALSVTDAEILKAAEFLSKKCGLFVEPSGAVSAAGLFRLVKNGRLSRKDRVACVLTGSGLKHVHS